MPALRIQANRRQPRPAMPRRARQQVWSYVSRAGARDGLRSDRDGKRAAPAIGASANALPHAVLALAMHSSFLYPDRARNVPCSLGDAVSLLTGDCGEAWRKWG